jgi:hypothetical protein
MNMGVPFFTPHPFDTIFILLTKTKITQGERR